MNVSDQNIDFIFVEDNVCHQFGNAYLQNEKKTARKVALPPAKDGDPPNPLDPDFIDWDEIRLMNNAFAYTFKQARLATTGGAHIEENIFVGNMSTIMRALTSKDGVLLSYFEKIKENEINITSLKQMLKAHKTATNKRKISRQQPLEHLFGFCESFKKITKGLVFHLTFKTAVMQNSF